MKSVALVLLMLICVSICGQASGAFITEEWKQEMMGEKSYRPLDYLDWPQCFDTVTVYNGPGEQYPVVEKNAKLWELHCMELIGDWGLVFDYPSLLSGPNPKYLGYIHVGRLGKKPAGNSLHFANVIISAPNDCHLLSEPFEGPWNDYIAIIPKGESIRLLSTYEDYAYVETSVDGVPIRGYLSIYDYSYTDFQRDIEKAGLFTGTQIDLKDLYTYQYAVRKKDSIASGNLFTVGLKSDGTVVARGQNEFGQCDVQEWNNIIALSAGYNHTVGLRSDGTVVATGSNEYGQCDIGEWENVVAISAGYRHTVGLLESGRIVVAGDNTYHQHDLYHMMGENVIVISAGGFYTIALTGDGRVLKGGNWASETYTYFCNDYYTGRASIGTDDWVKMISIAAGGRHATGLRSDGLVFASGESSAGELGNR